MTMRVRAGLMLVVALGIMGLANCDHYVCTSGAQFGSSTCTSSAPSLGGSTGTGSATAAFAFVADQGAADGTAGTIDGYTLNTSASTFGATPSYTAPSIPPGDPGTGMVVAQSQYLYVGFASTDQIFAWTVSSSGALTAISGSPYTAPFMAGVGDGIGSNSIITNPAGNLLFFADTLSDQIFIYQIGTGGALTAASPSSIPVPFEPVNMATDGLGKYLYVTSNGASIHTGSEVAAYVIGSSGTLTAVPGSPFAFPMWQVAGEPTGNFLIGTSGHSKDINGTDDDSLYVFSITQSGSSAGALTAVTGSPFATVNSPLSIAVQSNTGGDLVFSFGVNDTLTGFNPPEGYSINSGGTLTAVSGSPFSNAEVGYLGAFDQSGAFMFLGMQSFLGVGDGSGVITYQLSAFDVSSAGAVTQPTTTLTLPTAGVWAVTDPQ
jgi:hypothetical protein